MDINEKCIDTLEFDTKIYNFKNRSFLPASVSRYTSQEYALLSYLHNVFILNRESYSQLSVNSEILLSGFIKTILLTDNVKLALCTGSWHTGGTKILID